MLGELASRQVGESAERHWSDALVAIHGRKTDFSGDFQKPNLTMRENLGTKGFSHALISNELKIICKACGNIYTPVGYRGVGGTSLV